MTKSYSVISFPSLGIEINPPRYLEITEDFRMYYYALFIAVGLLLAVIYGLARKKQFGLKENDILDGVLWIVPFSIICARVYYCAFMWEEKFAADPISVLYIWNGGIAIYGAIIGAAIGVVIHCLIKKISLPAVLDLVALGFLIGQCIGRWGNFINREAFGAETESFLRMGLQEINSGVTTYHHPTFLYESVWNLVGFVALHFLSKVRKYDGQIALGYVAWYGLGRTFIEGLRTDSLYIGTMRVSQLVAAITCFLAVAVLLWQLFVPHRREKLFVNVVAAREAEAAALEAAEAEALEAEEAAEEEIAEEAAAEEAPAEATEEDTDENNGI